MSLPGCHKQGIQDPAPDAVLGISPDPYLPGNLIRGGKTDSADILRQPVWICLHDSVEIRAVGLPDPGGTGTPDTIFLEKNHGVPQVLPVLHLSAEFPCHPQADPLDPGQLLRFLFHDPQSIISEFFDDPARQCLTDPFDAARRKIAVNGVSGFGGNRLIRLKAKLFPVDRMCGEISRYGTALTFTDRNGIPHTGQGILLNGLISGLV